MSNVEMEDDNPAVSASESDSDVEIVRLTEPSKTAVYNHSGLLDKLEDIKWPENADWRHKLAFVFSQEQEVDVNDDLTRELTFNEQGLEATREAFLKFQSTELRFWRPSDYNGPMMKSDSVMEKVKGELLEEKKKAKEAEETRKAKDNKKLSKEKQGLKQKEGTKQNKEVIESVKKLRKQRQQSEFPSEGEDDEFNLSSDDGKAFEESGEKSPGVGPGDPSGGKAREGGGKGKKGFDRKRKEKEFFPSKKKQQR